MNKISNNLKKEVDHLKIPATFTIDHRCNELLLFHLGKFICTLPKMEEYKNIGINVYITRNCPLQIQYKRKWHYVCIVKDNEGKHYWYMRPYNKLYFTTRAEEDDPASFDMVIQAVIDNEKLFS